LKRNLLIRNIGRKFNLREKLIEAELDKALDFQKKQNRLQSQRIFKKEEAQQESLSQQKENHCLYNTERELIRLLFENNENNYDNIQRSQKIYLLISTEMFLKSLL
jgi:uncharacterized protein YjaZ